MQQKVGGHDLVLAHRGPKVEVKSGHRRRLRQVGARPDSSELEGGNGAETVPVST